MMEYIDFMADMIDLDDETREAWIAAEPVIKYGEKCDNLFDFMSTVATMIDTYVSAHNMSPKEDDDMMQTIVDMRKQCREEFKRTF